MSSQTRDTRGDANGLDLRTLAIASFAAAVAAIVVSRIWTAGTPIAAAATPVIVTLLKELLDRPTARIAERMTTESAALRETRVRPPETRATEVTPADEHTPGEVRVYRQESAGASGAAQRIKPKVVLVTAAIAFVIAGVVITGGQALAGNPFGKDGTGAIILGQHKAGKKKTTTTETETQTAPQQTVTETTPQEQAPQQTTTTPRQQAAPDQRDQEQDTTTTPTETTTTPSN